MAEEIKAPDECCRLVVQVDYRNSSPGKEALEASSLPWFPEAE